MTKRTALGALLLGIVCLTGGCRSTAEAKAIFATAKALQVAPAYVMGEGDQVTIQVLGEDQPSITAAVRPDGKVSFPDHGEIQVAGKTPDQLREELTVSFRKTLGLREPKVHVAVDSFASKNVTVLGQVTRPGRYPYTGQMRVADLLGRAIGVPFLTGSANRALLFREVEGKTKVYRVRLDDFFKKADFSTNYYVRPGDVLYVPRNTYASISARVQRFLSPIGAIVSGIGLGRQASDIFIPEAGIG
jgi:polysaccharide export outer membrane protein